MKKILYGTAAFAFAVLFIGIIGNVECGASLWQLLWCIPVMAAILIFSKLFHIEYEKECDRCFEEEYRRYCEAKKRKTVRAATPTVKSKM